MFYFAALIMRVRDGRRPSTRARLLGLYLLANPPRFSLGLALNLVLLALLISAVVAFLPASWFFQPSWRASYVNDLGISLPTTLSAQPWMALTCLLSLVAGLSWLYVVCSLRLEF